MVDGYDEISETLRKKVSERLLTFEASGFGRFYLTCREFYHIYDLKVPQVRIAPFDQEDQERYVKSFASAFGSRIKPKEMLAELRSRGLKDLLEHPLLLAMVCIVRSGSMSIHSRSVLTLIDRALETLSFRWDEGKGIARESKLPIDGRARVQCLMGIAFSSDHPQVSERTVLSEARKFLDRLRWEDLDERRLVMETAQFYGILVPKDATSWEFVHKTLHDYLAARYWVETGTFRPDQVQKWNSRAAYAACLAPDATSSMTTTLSKKEWIPAFVEMFSNDAQFDHSVIAHELLKHYERHPRTHFYEKSDSNRISVQLSQDFTTIASTKFLQDLSLACTVDGSIKARDTFFAYCLAELRDRGRTLSRTAYARALRKYGAEFVFNVNRGGAWRNIPLKEMVPE